jgi:hypothetical protein
VVKDSVAKECAEAFKAGYAAGQVIDQDLHVQGTLHRFYTCMTEAVRKCPLSQEHNQHIQRLTRVSLATDERGGPQVTAHPLGLQDGA